MRLYSIDQHSNNMLHTLQVLYMWTLCDSTNINPIIAFVPNCSHHFTGNGFNGGSDSYLQFRKTHAPCLLKLYIRTSNGIVRGWLFPEFVVELPLDNCTPTIILNNLVYIHSVRQVKTNRLKFLFPQSGYNIRLKDVHILNAQPFSEDFNTVLKGVFLSKLEGRVSDLNLLHYVPVLRFAVSIFLRSFHWKWNTIFFCLKITKSTDPYFFSEDSTVFLLGRADWKLFTGVSNNV